MSLDDSFEKVRAFHIAFNHDCPPMPEFLPQDRMQKRLSWMTEELDEFRDAMTIQDQADAMIDLIYFALGTLVEMGVRPGKLFDIVHNANMQKLWPDGKVHYGPDGKVIKHPSWTNPEPKLVEEIQLQMQNSSATHIQRVPDRS